MGFLAKLMETHSNGGTDYNKFTLLSTDETTDATIGDYVVEQGTDGIWTYRKWASGIAECWGFKAYSSAISSSWGGIGGYYAQLGAVDDYPFTFTNRPTVSITTQVATNRGWGVYATQNDTNSKTNVGTIDVYSPIQYTSAQTIIINIHAIGRWK